MSADNSNKPYTIPQLVVAINDYKFCNDALKAAAQKVAAKQAELNSLIKDEAKAQTDVDRHAATVKKIAANLEK